MQSSWQSVCIVNLTWPQKILKFCYLTGHLSQVHACVSYQKWQDIGKDFGLFCQNLFLFHLGSIILNIQPCMTSFLKLSFDFGFHKFANSFKHLPAPREILSKCKTSSAPKVYVCSMSISYSDKERECGLLYKPNEFYFLLVFLFFAFTNIIARHWFDVHLHISHWRDTFIQIMKMHKM